MGIQLKLWLKLGLLCMLGLGFLAGCVSPTSIPITTPTATPTPRSIILTPTPANLQPAQLQKLAEAARRSIEEYFLPQGCELEVISTDTNWVLSLCKEQGLNTAEYHEPKLFISKWGTQKWDELNPSEDERNYLSGIFSPDNNWLVLYENTYGAESNSIWVYPTGQWDKHYLLRNELTSINRLFWSPNGKYLLVFVDNFNHPESSLWLYTVGDWNNPHLLIHENASLLNIDWSPDSQDILATWYSRKTALSLIALDGTEYPLLASDQICPSPKDTFIPFWIDQTTIAYPICHPGDFYQELLEVAYLDIKTLKSYYKRPRDINTWWSPSGKSNIRYDKNYWLMTENYSISIPIPSEDYIDYYLWSPDEKKICYYDGRINVIFLSDDGRYKFNQFTANKGWPISWANDNKRMIFLQQIGPDRYNKINIAWIN